MTTRAVFGWMILGWVLTLMVSSCNTTPTAKSVPELPLENPEVPRITCQELKQLIDKDNAPVLVDTRSVLSYQRGHIKGAMNIPDDTSPSLRSMNLLKLPTDHLIVPYCD